MSLNDLAVLTSVFVDPTAYADEERFHAACRELRREHPSIAGGLGELTTLGRTGLQVSVAGLGSGGHSRLGLGNGGTEVDAIAVVHRALERLQAMFGAVDSFSAN